MKTVQCESMLLSEVTTLAEVLIFGTVDNFCRESPHGLGLNCIGSTPVTPDWRTHALLRSSSPTRIHRFFQMCTQFCRCVDNNEAPSGSMSETTATATTILSATGSRSAIAIPAATGHCRPGWRDLFTAQDDSWFQPQEEALCSAEWYGHPLPEDCVVALNQLPQNNGHFEFLGTGVEPAGNGRDREGCLVDSPPLRGPIIKTHGR